MDQTTEVVMFSNLTPSDRLKTNGNSHSLVLIAFSTVTTMTILIHLWIVLSIVCTSRLHSVSNILLASLSSSEILTGVTSFWSVSKLLNIDHEYPILDLKLFFCSIHTVIICYIFNSVAIAADRYFKVSHPMQYLRLVTKQKCAASVAFVWCLALACWIFMYAMVRDKNVGEKATVQILMVESYAQTSIIIMNVTILPSIIVTFCFIVALIHIVRKQQRKVQQEMQMQQRLNHSQQGQSVHVDNPLPMVVNRLLRNQHRRTTIYFIAHFSAFVVAWLPGHIAAQVGYMHPEDFQAFASALVFFLITAGVQISTGTMFLTFMQKEHRQVLQRAFQVVKSKCGKICCK